MVKHAKKPIFEYDKITKYIYIGTNQCCQFHFKKELIKKGVKADISLEKIRLDQPFGVKYYLWLPTEQNKTPNIEQLKIGADFIKDLVNRRISVYVHCQNGHGRAPSLVACYFILSGKTTEESIELIKEKRKTISPNKYQLNQIKKFEKKFK